MRCLIGIIRTVQKPWPQNGDIDSIVRNLSHYTPTEYLLPSTQISFQAPSMSVIITTHKYLSSNLSTVPLWLWTSLALCLTDHSIQNFVCIWDMLLIFIESGGIPIYVFQWNMPYGYVLYKTHSFLRFSLDTNSWCPVKCYPWVRI